ncbi:MAG: hypothetical protein ACRC1K_21945, partial [Planctomycetia bacterium]
MSVDPSQPRNHPVGSLFDGVACARPQAVLEWGGNRTVLGARPLILGIVNCTPDSFSDGGAL